MPPIVNARLPYADPASRPPKKIPIHTMIADARHELRQRENFDANGTARPRSRQSEGKVLVERQAAIVETLLWVQANRDAVMEWLAEKQAGGAE